MFTVRQVVKRMFPERLLLFRYELAERLSYYPRLLSRLGSRLECPLCGWRFRRFRPAGFEYPVIIEKRVIGGHYHPDNICPRCLSNARERLAYLFLRARTPLFTQEMVLLHIAPEPELASALKRSPNIRYVSADLALPGVMTRFDVLHMPFPEKTFDAIICNHVMEHVADDQIAMAEVYRVLKPGGWALLQVPIALALAQGQTIEDPTATTEADRIRVFGQGDHVRLYAAPDYVQRLERAGFRVAISKCATELPGEAARYALEPEEHIFVGAKPDRLDP
jgi:SAM-dependent methyltransferase